MIQNFGYMVYMVGMFKTRSRTSVESIEWPESWGEAVGARTLTKTILVTYGPPKPSLFPSEHYHKRFYEVLEV